MKIRLDFVTNSSSSSFLIAYKKLPDIDAEILKKYPFLIYAEKMVNGLLSVSGNYSDTTKAVVFETRKDWIDHLIDECGCDDEDELVEEYGREFYGKTLALYDQGYQIFEKNVGYDDDSLKELIRLVNDGDSFIILRDE